MMLRLAGIDARGFRILREGRSAAGNGMPSSRKSALLILMLATLPAFVSGATLGAEDPIQALVSSLKGGDSEDLELSARHLVQRLANAESQLRAFVSDKKNQRKKLRSVREAVALLGRLRSSAAVPELLQLTIVTAKDIGFENPLMAEVSVGGVQKTSGVPGLRQAAFKSLVEIGKPALSRATTYYTRLPREKEPAQLLGGLFFAVEVRGQGIADLAGAEAAEILLAARRDEEQNEGARDILEGAIQHVRSRKENRRQIIKEAVLQAWTSRALDGKPWERLVTELLKLENMMAVESTLINALKVHKEKNARKVLLKALENVRSGKKSE